jgi:hypothetical protein
VILLGGLYFRAPWKILVLDSILLALLTVVPKQKRKYGWLALAVAVLAVTVWIFIPEKDTGEWKPYTLDAELKAFNDKYAVSDEENAASIYQQIAETLDVFKEREKFWEWDPEDETLHRGWTKEEFPEVASWIYKHQESIKLMQKASKKTHCQMPYSFNSWSFRDYKLMYRLKFYALTLLRVSHFESLNLKQKINTQISAYTIGSHLTERKQMVYILMGLGIKSVALDELKNTIIFSNMTEQQTDDIYHAIKKNNFNWNERLPAILDYSILYSKNSQASLMFEKNTENKIRFTHHSNLHELVPPEDRETFSENINEASKLYKNPARIKLHLVMTWLFSVPESEVLLEIIDDVYSTAYEMTNSSFDWSATPEEYAWHEIELNPRYLQTLYLLELKSSLYNFHDHYLRSNCQEQGIQIILGLKKYQQLNNIWPHSLNEIKDLCNWSLLDSVNGQDFVYKQKDDDFILYSKGPNGIDERGKRETFISQEELKRLFNSKDDNKVKHVNMELKADDILIWPKELE